MFGFDDGKSSTNLYSLPAVSELRVPLRLLLDEYFSRTLYVTLTLFILLFVERRSPHLTNIITDKPAVKLLLASKHSQSVVLVSLCLAMMIAGRFIDDNMTNNIFQRPIYTLHVSS